MNETDKRYIEEAAAHFKALLTEQLKRQRKMAAEAEGPPGVGEGEGWFFMASREAPAAASMRIMIIRANIRCRFMVGLATYDEEKSSTTALYHSASYGILASSPVPAQRGGGRADLRIRTALRSLYHVLRFREAGAGR